MCKGIDFKLPKLKKGGEDPELLGWKARLPGLGWGGGVVP